MNIILFNSIQFNFIFHILIKRTTGTNHFIEKNKNNNKTEHQEVTCMLNKEVKKDVIFIQRIMEGIMAGSH